MMMMMMMMMMIMINKKVNGLIENNLDKIHAILNDYGIPLVPVTQSADDDD